MKEERDANQGLPTSVTSEHSAKDMVLALVRADGKILDRSDERPEAEHHLAFYPGAHNNGATSSPVSR